jgi:hypothetical protein
MKRKTIVIISVILIIALTAFGWWRYYFVFGEGVKAGTLNFVVRKGYIFKTWEGRLIQEGFKTPLPGAMQSNDLSSVLPTTALLPCWNAAAAALLNCATGSISIRCPGGG